MNNMTREILNKLNLDVNPIKKVGELTFGEQQLVEIAKALVSDSTFIIMDEPTRGIDVGTKSEIHKVISELVKNNVAVIMISSELPEILGISDRIIVIHEGELTGELDFKQANEHNIMLMATGLYK